MAYEKPILFEIVASIHFKSGTFGPAQFFEVVPQLKNRGHTVVEMGQSHVVEAKENEIEFQPGVRCWTPDKTRLVQLVPDKISVNHVVRDEGYIGWDEYRKLFDDALTDLRNSGVPYEPTSLELLTIDQFKAPKDGFRLGDYLACGGPKIPSWYADAGVASDLNLGMGFPNIDGFNQMYQIRLRIEADLATVKINSRFHRLLGDGQDITDLLEVMHQDSNAHFEELITDKTRNEVMGGVLAR